MQFKYSIPLLSLFCLILLGCGRKEISTNDRIVSLDGEFLSFNGVFDGYTVEDVGNMNDDPEKKSILFVLLRGKGDPEVLAKTMSKYGVVEKHELPTKVTEYVLRPKFNNYYIAWSWGELKKEKLTQHWGSKVKTGIVKVVIATTEY